MRNLGSSFALDKTVLHTFLLHIAFYAAIYVLIIMPFNMMFFSVYEQLQTLPTLAGSIEDFTDPELEEQLSAYKWLPAKLILLLGFLFFGSMILYTLFKGMIWSRINGHYHHFSNRLMSWSYYYKSLAYNIALFLLALLFMLIILQPFSSAAASAAAQPSVFSLLLMLVLVMLIVMLLVYCSAYFYARFKGRLWQTCKEVMHSFRGIHRHWLPLLIIVILFIAIFAITLLLMSRIPGVAGTLLTVLLLLLFFAWARKYFYTTVHKG